MAALLVADAALAVATRPGPAGAPVSAGAGAPGSFAAHAAPRPAATPPAGPTAPAAAAAPASGALALAPVGKAAPAPAPRSSPAGRATQGVASWLDISAGTCANNDAPMGAVITVTSAAGISITCTVVSRGPFVAGRVVDLARSSFALLGPVSKGLVSVSVTW